MSDNAMTKDSIKFWTFLTVMLLAVAVAVTLIDLTIKAAILAESTSMKLAMEEWEVRYGFRQAGRIDEGNNSNAGNNGHLSGDVLDTGNAGMETRSLAELAKKQATERPPRKPKPIPPTGD